MKNLKRLACFVLVLTLLSGLFAGAAFADSKIAKYDSTRQFLEELEDEDIRYHYMGIDSDKDEEVDVTFDDDDGKSYTLHFFFDENEENCSVRLWNMVKYSKSGSADAYKAVNSLNSAYKYVKFVADDTDNSVTMEMDLIFRDFDVGEICSEALYYMLKGITESADTLARLK